MLSLWVSPSMLLRRCGLYQDFYLVLWDHPFDQTLRFVDFGLALERVQRCADAPFNETNVQGDSSQ